MDIGNIIYIIAIIIYFIYTAVKKGQKPDGYEGQENNPSEGKQERRPASFEDLLKEIRQGQQQREKDLPQTGQGNVSQNKPTPRQEVESRDFEPERNISRWEREKPRSKAFGDYEGTVEDIEIPKLKTLDEQVSLSASVEGIKSSLKSERAKTAQSKSRYAEMLSNPSTVKDAVILSEILNRKNF